MVTSTSAINLMANNFLLLTNQSESSPAGCCSASRTSESDATATTTTTTVPPVPTSGSLTATTANSDFNRNNTTCSLAPSTTNTKTFFPGQESNQISRVRKMCRSSSSPTPSIPLTSSKSGANNLHRENFSLLQLQPRKIKRGVMTRGRLLSWTPARDLQHSKIPRSSRTTLSLKNTNSLSSIWTLSLIGVILISLCGGCQGARINQYGGYEDVVVSVGNEVPPITCQQLIQNLQGIFTSASEYLYGATRGKSYFHRIVVVLPPSWDSRACSKMLPDGSHTSASTIAEADFRVGGEHPIFGHLPFTQQSQGCTKPGDFISVGYQYILQYNDTEMGHSFPDRAFVHEWAKFRYGVFEEIGFENDTIYPISYLEASGNSRRTEDERKATSCTNRPLKGNWSGSSCTSNDPKGNNCVFVPSLNDNDNITSSIMSHPHLPHVRSFCDSSTHNRVAPTKQNFLCDKKSVSEIMATHPDFHNISGSSRNGRGVTPEFVVKQLTQPRFVLLVEETGNMNLRDVWKYMKLAIRKFIKYDLPTGTQIGLMTVNTDIRILANMTSLDESLRGTLADKLPNYPSIDTSGSLSLRKGISQAINMLKWNGQRVAGSVIVLISQGTINVVDLEASLHLLRQEEVSIATIEYPSIGDGKISTLSQGTNSPHFAIRETGVGTMSHMSTYIQLVNAMMEIQRFFTKGIASRWPVLIHQEEFKGDAPSFVESSFNFDGSQTPGEFYIYIPNPIDPKVNKVELTSPSGTKFTDQLSLAHDINVIKIDAVIDQPGIWRYKIQRLGDSHQSHFVQVVTNEYLVGSSGANEEFIVKLYSNVDATRSVNLSQKPLIIYADVKRGPSPVLEADVEVLILAGTVKWSVKLLDNGNGDADLTRGDGIYSRYIVPPASIQSSLLDITVRVTTTPYRSKFIGHDSNSFGRKTASPCCGSVLNPSSPSALKTMAFNERVVASYIIKISNPRTSEVYRPSRIGDLRVLGTYDTEVVLSFTAPGDDYDQGMVQDFRFYYSRSLDSPPVLKEQYPNKDAQAGTTVNATLQLPNYGLFYLTVVAVDPYGNTGLFSNVARVKTMAPPAETYGGSSQSQVDKLPKKDGDGGNGLSTLEIVLIAVGGVAFLILLILLIVCCYRRRRNSKGMGSTETKISTISDTKAPIHWSASELLQEHEKRQSIYAQSQPPSNGTGHHGQHQNYGYSEKNVQVQQQQPFNVYMGSNGSPGSSTRSFRSISENNRKTSVDSSRRPTLTDYESCSSDPTVKSLKGPTDYDTPVESDQENYRTIDSFANGPYRHNSNFVSLGMSKNGGSHMQYNPNIQGSLTSVNSKRRNITMV